MDYEEGDIFVAVCMLVLIVLVCFVAGFWLGQLVCG